MHLMGPSGKMQSWKRKGGINETKKCEELGGPLHYDLFLPNIALRPKISLSPFKNMVSVLNSTLKLSGGGMFTSVLAELVNVSPSCHVEAVERSALVKLCNLIQH